MRGCARTVSLVNDLLLKSTLFGLIYRLVHFVATDDIQPFFNPSKSPFEYVHSGYSDIKEALPDPISRGLLSLGNNKLSRSSVIRGRTAQTDTSKLA